eukprot:GHUV01039348.1.p1 GENE.GHUV01039348.1~~GHUV01039348.1.p1  ORF type:complete len:182 (+),score=48.41 GHUV01039348.1:268-813(+)
MAPTAAGTGLHMNAEPLNQFEAERARIIARNRQKMEAMGVIDAAGKLHSLVLPQSDQPKYINAKKRSKPAASPMLDAPARASRRLRGLAVDSTTAVADTASTTNSSTSSPAQQSSSPAAPAGPKQPAYDLHPNVQYTTPFTLASIGNPGWLFHYQSANHVAPGTYAHISQTVVGRVSTMML